MRLFGRWFFKEWQAAALILFSLFVGSSTFFFVDKGKSSLENLWTESASRVLGADGCVQARSLLSKEDLVEIKGWLGNDPSRRFIEYVEFYSLLSFEKKTRLVEVVAIDPGYPLYPGLDLKAAGPQNQPWTDKNSLISGQGGIFLSKDLAGTLGVPETSGRVRLVNREFGVLDWIERDERGSTRFFGLGPRVIISKNQIQDLSVFTKGAIFRSRICWKDGGDVSSLTTPEKLDADAEKKISLKEWVYFHPKKAMERMVQVTDQLTLFLKLITGASFVLAFISAVFALRQWLTRVEPSFAVVLALGVRRRTIFWALVGALILIALLAYGLSLAVALVGLTRITHLFGETRLDFRLTGRDFGIFLLWILTTALGFSTAIWPFFRRFSLLPLSRLFQEEGDSETFSVEAGRQISKSQFSKSLTASFFDRKISRTRNRWWALQGLLLLSFVTILIPLQVGQNLLKGLDRSENIQTPDFFLFDVQDGEKEKFLEWAASQDIEIQRISPMVRGRILEKNGENWRPKLDESSEEAKNDAGRRGTHFNLSYRKGIDPSEQLLTGRIPVVGAAEDPIEITFEERFAERNGFKVGDFVRFDIQGVPIETTVVGIRRIDWLSFQPNFFIQTAERGLETAPKTWIVSVKIRDENIRPYFLGKVVDQFPGISGIEVKEILNQAKKWGTYLAISITFLSTILAVSALLLVLALAGSLSQMIPRENRLLHWLGLSNREILKIRFREVGFGITAPILAAALLGSGVSFILVERMARVPFSPVWWILMGIPIVGNILITVGYLKSMKWKSS